MNEIDTSKNGAIISVRVIYVPVCLSGRREYSLKFEYNGKIYPKHLRGKPCNDFNVGDIIKLKTNVDHSIFLFENENPYKNTIAFILLMLFGVFVIFYGFRRSVH